MHFTKKDRQIAVMKREISRLREENEILTEEIRLCNPDHVEEKMKLAEKSYCEYNGLIKELKNLKIEYQSLIKEMAKDKQKLKRNCC